MRGLVAVVEPLFTLAALRLLLLLASMAPLGMSPAPVSSCVAECEVADDEEALGVRLPKAL